MRGRRFSQRRRDKIAVRQFTFGQTLAAGQNSPAVFGKFFTVTLVVFQRAGCGHRPEPIFLSRRIANRNRVDFFLELLDQRIRNFVINVDSRHRRTFLSAQSKRGTHNPVCRAIEICIRSHNASVLAAHFGDARSRIYAIGHGAVDMHADVNRSGEGNSGGIGMV